jgi:AcrR family transcriptional regulator
MNRPSEARTRLLTTAIGIFYAEGIHAVGVDRIIAEAKVTRATFYRHFPSKEDLVLEYLRQVHALERGGIEAAVDAHPVPAEALRAIAEGIAQNIQRPGFRGCAFLNAAAEYHDPGDPVHQQVVAHRQWFLETITALMAQADKENAEHAARAYVLLRDGAMAAGCLSGPDQVTETFLRGIDGLLRANNVVPLG